MVKMGDQNEEVRELQRRLISEGYNCGPYGADGDFGKGTYDAVIRFQQEVGLEADGIVGTATWNALRACTMDEHGGIMKLGDKGTDVRVMQNMLIDKGYSCGSSGADGDFGQGTYNAVVAFQRDHGLEQDGVVGNQTMSALRNTYSTDLLKLGSNSPAVREAQRLLINKGYNCGSSGADGDFGQGTWNAVFSFQKDHGLTADGIIGPATWAALRNGTTSEILRMGSRGSSVVLLQNRLISSGYSCGSYGADGVFGQSTLDSVIAFQRAHGLDADGVVGPATWAALNGNSAAGRGILRKGSKGEGVRELQRILIALGYSCGSYGADGDFGDGTFNAVIAFQRAHGLDADGIVGPATWAVLSGLDPSYVIPSGSVGVARFLEIARSQLGYHEVGENWTKYGNWYGLDGNAWCAMFVSWCANNAGILGATVPSYALCSDGVAVYSRWKRYRTRTSGYRPKPGDVFFLYDSSESIPYCHTGIVEYLDGNTIHTIEGNSSDMVRRCTRNINDWNIDGYGDNGGIKEPSISDAELYKQESNRSFAKLFGITIKSTQEIEIPIPFMLAGITVKYKFSKEDKFSSSTSARSNGTISIKNGKITTDISTPYADTSKIRKIKNLIEKPAISQQLLKLGDCKVDITIKIVNDSCLDIVLSQSYKVSDELTVTQSIEIIFYPGRKFDNAASLALGDPLYEEMKKTQAIMALAFLAMCICSTTVITPAVVPELEEVVEEIEKLLNKAA